MHKEDAPYAGIICPVHNKVDITRKQYTTQMADPHSVWKCPRCGCSSDFDDHRFDELHPE